MFDAIKQKISPEKASLSKAMLIYEIDGGTGGEIICQFNPASLTVSKQVDWRPVTASSDTGEESQPDLNAPDLVFAGGMGARFSLDLIFDTTILGNIDVRVFTNELLRLTLMGGGDPGSSEKDPPLVTFIWGEMELFEAVIEAVQINYTMFLPDGTPVRARAHVDFLQAYDGDSPLPAQNPTSRSDPRKIHRVHSGDRLDNLAFKEYGRSDMWREIAEANDLSDPTQLMPGQSLILPPKV